MSDYKPKVGEEYDSSFGKIYTALFVTEKHVLGRLPTGEEHLSLLVNCKPIPTKADIELNELIEILGAYVNSDIPFTAGRIQGEGFTKSKEVEKVDFEALAESLLDWTFSDDEYLDTACWWQREGKALLGHLIKNAPEVK